MNRDERSKTNVQTDMINFSPLFLSVPVLKIVLAVIRKSSRLVEDNWHDDNKSMVLI